MHKLEENINTLTKKILSDYKENRTIDEDKAFDHPDNEDIVEIIEALRKLVFPGYFRNKSYRVYTVRNNISMILEDVIFKLIRQISIVLRYEKKYAEMNDNEINENAERITFEFLDKLPKIRSYIETDVQAAYDGDPAAYNKDEIIYSYPGLYAILVNRLAHELFLLGVPLIPRVIGKYFFIDHGTGIVIGETTEIGENVKVYQGVTLGALSTRGGQSLRNKKRHPTIEDNVTIYSGASILGGETVVGKNAVIGGNAFITRSIPEGAKVSIKNQELRYNFDSQLPVQKSELDPEESWFYII